MKIAFLGNFTIDLLVKDFEKAIGEVDIYVSGFNQYIIDIIDRNSNYNKFKPDYTIVLLEGNSLFSNMDIKEVKAQINDLFETNLENNNSYFIVSNIIVDSNINTIYNYNFENNVKQIQNEFNLFLNNIAIRNKHFFVLDIVSILEKYGKRSIYDNSLWLYGKIRYNKLGNKLIIEKLLHLLNAINNNIKKCLVLDLDNTLWKGIIGEDGMEGIKLGKDEIGNIYFNFQKTIKEIKAKGVLLTICSKNNISDVKEVFENHKYSVLKWDDFIIKKINWRTKDKNIKEIAQELNIGEDSLVFIDDNAFERELVRANTEVIVPDFPQNIEDLPDFIAEIDEKYFSKFNVTNEDRLKTEQYFDNLKRDEIKKKITMIDEYVKTLNIKLTIEPYKEENLDRIAQMTQKTNQFNFTTKRYSEKDIHEISKNKNYIIFTGRLVDKFGDYGIVNLIIIKIDKSTAFIDTFLMSCRAIGMYIEHYYLYNIFNILKQKSINEIVSYYLPTRKNALIENKYDELGFELNEKYDDGSKKYIFDLKTKMLNSEIIEKRLIDVFYEG